MIKAIPTESQEQKTLFEWLEWAKKKHPELEWCYHVPNGGSRHAAEAVHLKAQGVKPGVPDICLPVARGGYHGLYIELKRAKGGRLSEAQQRWLDALNEQGYRAVVCNGCDEAITIISEYIAGEDDGKNSKGTT